jgi:hypothetical protein
VVYGIYKKSKPKSKWYLISVAVSAEATNKEINDLKNKAISEGNEAVEFGSQLFDSQLWMPEFIKELKDQKPIFN